MKRLTFTKPLGILEIGLSSPFVWDFRPATGNLSKRLARCTVNTNGRRQQRGDQKRHRILGTGDGDARRRIRWGRTLEFLTHGGNQSEREEQ
jgi:hypothetical protein